MKSIYVHEILNLIIRGHFVCMGWLQDKARFGINESKYFGKRWLMAVVKLTIIAKSAIVSKAIS